MRDLILKMSISLDSFVAGTEGRLDWIFPTTDAGATAWILESVSRAGVHIMGSRTFADMAAYWPSSTEPFAAPMNRIPKVVFARGARPHVGGGATRGLDDARAQAASAPATPDAAVLKTWQEARVASGELADEIAKLKREPGGPIIAHGGASFAQSLVRLGAIDEYQLLVHPVALGRGLPLFSQLDAPRRLALVDVKRFEHGAVAHVYRPR